MLRLMSYMVIYGLFTLSRKILFALYGYSPLIKGTIHYIYIYIYIYICPSEITCDLVSSHYRSDITLAIQLCVVHDQPWSNITPHQTKTTAECICTVALQQHLPPSVHIEAITKH